MLPVFAQCWTVLWPFPIKRAKAVCPPNFSMTMSARCTDPHSWVTKMQCLGQMVFLVLNNRYFVRETFRSGRARDGSLPMGEVGCGGCGLRINGEIVVQIT